MGKTRIVLSYDLRQPLEPLSYEERGRLFTAILDYPESGRAPDFNGALAMAFCFIRQDLDRSAGRRDGTRAAGTKACGAPRNGEPPRRRDGRAR